MIVEQTNLYPVLFNNTMIDTNAEEIKTFLGLVKINGLPLPNYQDYRKQNSQVNAAVEHMGLKKLEKIYLLVQ